VRVVFTETFQATASEKPQKAWSRPDARMSTRLHSVPSKCEFDPNWKHKYDWARFTTGDRGFLNRHKETSGLLRGCVVWYLWLWGRRESPHLIVCLPQMKWDDVLWHPSVALCHWGEIKRKISAKSLESKDHTPRSQITGLFWLFSAEFDARVVNKTLKRES